MGERKFNLVVLASGGGTNLQSIIDSIASETLDARISGVISDVENAYALQRADQAEILSLVIIPESYVSKFDYEDVLAQTIAKFVPDLIVLAGFMRILSPDFVSQFHGQIVNIHPSLLPKYKGLNTHQRVIDAGDKVHGATVHFVTAELDDGPIINQAEVDVDSSDDANSLQQKVLTQEHVIYPKAIQMIAEGKISFDNSPNRS